MIVPVVRSALVALAIQVAATGASAAQEPVRGDSAGPAPATMRSSLLDAFGPLALGRSAWVAAVDQYRRVPLGWPHNARGYSERFGYHVGGEALAGTFRFAMRRALHEQEAPFTFCDCVGRIRRARHALAMPFRAFPETGGHAHASLLTPVSEFGSGFLWQTFRPGGIRLRDGLLAGAGALGGQAGLSLAREFWPWPWRVANRLERKARARLPRRFRGSATTDSAPPAR